MSQSGPFATPPSIATKAELDQLREARPQPVAEPHLKPDGPDARSVDERLVEFRESRMANLQDRLQSAREGMEHDHTFAQLEGRAKGDFGHNR